MAMRRIGTSGSDAMRTPTLIRQVGKVVPVHFSWTWLSGLWLPFANSYALTFFVHLGVILRIRDISITAERDR